MPVTHPPPTDIPPYLASLPRIVASQVDYLTCSVTAPLPDDIGVYLTSLLVASEGEPEHTLWSFGDEPVIAGFSRSGAPYLHNDMLDVRFRFGPGETTAVWTLYSLAFWRFGAEMAVARLQRFVDEFYRAHQVLKPGRLDLCRDLVAFPVPQLSLRDLRDTVVCEARKISAYGNGDNVQTWQFGTRSKANCLARIYDKSAELLQSKKLYYGPVWEAAGYDAAVDGPITRVEFEIHTAFWREWRTDDNRVIESLQDLLCELNAVWRYCSSSWLRFVPSKAASSDSNVSRIPSTDAWLIVSSRFDRSAAMTAGDRYQRRMPDVDALKKQIAGCFRSVAAMNKRGHDWTIARYAKLAQEAMVELQERRGRDLSFLVKQRRGRIMAGVAI